MRKPVIVFMFVFAVFSFLSTASNATADSSSGTKEWTFLIYLNGNNNLDSFGSLNINQMEEVGSTADINIVVQWASLKNKKTQRLYVVQDKNTQKVTSPVVADVGKVDMGDWHSLVSFVQWGVTHYPAKHYFIDIWDHGSGWHAIQSMGGLSRSGFHVTDISWDDNTGNSITTQQLGQALAESAKIIGHKVDLYASDACLMAMPEIANEMSDSVEIYAGSEEVEPGAGWPYQTFMQKWAAKPKSSAAEVASYLTQEYVASYNGGVNGSESATFSAFDLNNMDAFNRAIADLGQAFMKLNAPDRTKVVQAATSTQRFTFDDYADLKDFLNEMEGAQVKGLSKDITQGARSAIDQFVVAHDATSSINRALGLSIWLPSSIDVYNSYADKYNALKFATNTKWGEALKAILH